jgi:hypothetical protein
MTRIPGFAVSLLGLLACFVAWGLIQLTRYWLRPLLTAFAAILKVIPLVGGFLSREVMAFERIVDGWLGSAALTLHRIGVGWLHGWTTLFARIGSEIAGLATDAYAFGLRLIRVTIPRLIRTLRLQLLRLLRAAEARIVALGRLIARQAAALGQRIATLARTIGAAVLRGIREAEAFALRALRAVEHALTEALHAVERAVAAAEHRIGQLEHEVFDRIWAELRRLADDLRPDRLIEQALAYVWGIVPRDVRLFLEWVWHWLHAGIEFLVALARGEWPPPMHHSTGKGIALGLREDAGRWAQAIRDEHGRH